MPSDRLRADASTSAALAAARRDAPAWRRALLDWYARAARDFPWRHGRFPRDAREENARDYRAWLTEILMQQTRLDQGLPYYRRFLERFPGVAALAAAPEDAVLKAWEGLGYYARARNLHAAARRVVEAGGRFPDDEAGWRALPGVGRYTAASLASMTRGLAAPLVDGNVRRVFARWFALAAAPDAPGAEALSWALAEILIPPPQPRAVPENAGFLAAWVAANPCGGWNEALMELGQTHCAPKRAACADCPVVRLCAAGRSGRWADYPAARAKKTVPHKAVVAAAVMRRGKLLVGRRPPGGMLAGLWEFPGGKVRPDETPEAALARELAEEVGVADAAVGPKLGEVDHAYSHFTITLSLYAVTFPPGARARALHHTELAWVSRAALDALALPTSDRNLLPALDAYLKAAKP